MSVSILQDGFLVLEKELCTEQTEEIYIYADQGMFLFEESLV